MPHVTVSVNGATRDWPADMETYDYIVVGAGSAGCVLADRLTASGRFRVLLIEAGGSDDRFWIKVPLGYGMTYADPAVNWCYTASIDPGLNHRRNFWPRGRVLGGSSSINALAYLRGLPHDFDDWERAGATGWNWETARAAFQTLETHVGPNSDEITRSDRRGPVHVADCSERMHPFSDHFLQAAKEMGWRRPRHLNGRAHEGIVRLRSTLRNRRRWSAADAFLRPAERRSNLRIVKQALVRRIVFDGHRAVGVEYSASGGLHTATCGREVILSAGAVNTPQLLQLSGVGSPALLQHHGIQVRHALNQVGKGLQDHLAISHVFRASEPTLNNRLGNWPGKIIAGLEYVLFRRGPLSVPVNQVGGFVRATGNDPVDMQIYCNPMSYRPTSIGPVIDAEAGFSLSAQPCRPTSRGEIAVVSSDPEVAPAIRPNSLSTEYDRQQAIKAGRLLERLAATPALQAVTQSRLAPGISEMSDDELLEDFRARAASVFHASCTCRMGQDPGTSVVDPQLRVHGLAGLRVIDASAFPNVTSGNTNAPVMMLAARAAQMIIDNALSPAPAADIVSTSRQEDSCVAPAVA